MGVASKGLEDGSRVRDSHIPTVIQIRPYTGVDSKKLEDGSRVIYADCFSSPSCGVWGRGTVIFQLSGVYSSLISFLG